MHIEQRQRTSELLRMRGITHALFAHPHSVTWLTGFAPPIQLGGNLFAGGPPLLWYDAGHYTLLTLDALAGVAGDLSADADCDVATYPGYTIEGADRERETTGRSLATAGRQAWRRRFGWGRDRLLAGCARFGARSRRYHPVDRH